LDEDEVFAAKADSEREDRPDGRAFWLIIPASEDQEVLAASPLATTGELIHRATGRVLVELSIPAGAVVRRKLL